MVFCMLNIVIRIIKKVKLVFLDFSILQQMQGIIFYDLTIYILQNTNNSIRNFMFIHLLK